MVWFFFKGQKKTDHRINQFHSLLSEPEKRKNETKWNKQKTPNPKALADLISFA